MESNATQNNPLAMKRVGGLVDQVIQDRPDATPEEVRQRVGFMIENNCVEHAPVLNRVPLENMAGVLGSLAPAPAAQSPGQTSLYPSMAPKEAPKSMYPSMGQK